MKKSIVLLLTAVLVILSGCSERKDNESLSLKETGKLIVSVNPEVEIEYHQDGKVVAVTARNAEAQKIMQDVSSYQGMQCADVVDDVVSRISEAGYFVDELDGNHRSIVIQIEPGSVLPSDQFLNEVSTSVQETVKQLNASNQVVSIGVHDYDQKYADKDNLSHMITLEKAKEIALTYFNLYEKDVRFTERDYDLEDGLAVYELEFFVDAVEYDVEIDAKSGKVVSAHTESEKVYSKNTSETSSSLGVEPTPEAASEISSEDAKQIALNHFSLKSEDVTFTKVEKDKEDGRVVYEIEMRSGNREYDVEINAKTGAVLSSDVEIEERKVEKPAPTPNPTLEPTPEAASEISSEDAKQIALNHFSLKSEDVTFTKVEKDRDDGRVVYEIEMRSGNREYEAEIDAKSGAVLGADSEIDD